MTESPARFAYVGCYTTAQRSGRGKGIAVYRIDPAGGAWTQVQLQKTVDNPSWLMLDAMRRTLYAAHGEGNVISSFRVDAASGQLALLSTQDAKGVNGVRLGIDAPNRFVVCANYNTGTVAVLPIAADGSLGAVVDLVQLHGTPGPHRTQQTCAHPHDVVFDPMGRYLLVPDKGLDATFAFSLEADGRLVPAAGSPLPSRSGAGPRHAGFHPRLPCAYILNELDSTLTTCRYDRDSGRLSALQIVTTLPAEFTGNNTTAEICVAASGRFVYVSNRGHDSLALFSTDPVDGTLRPVAWESTQGRTPRFFTFDPAGALLYCANLDSDAIVAFRVDPQSGRLTPVGTVASTGSPSSIVFG